MHDYTLLQWNCLLECRTLLARTVFGWLKFAIQWVFSEASYEQDDLGVNQFSHWAIYHQEADWSLPWDPLAVIFHRLGGKPTFKRGVCHVPGLCHVLGPAQVNQEDKVNSEAHWTKPGLNLGVSRVLGDVPM
jgi:hypothetical protein